MASKTMGTMSAKRKAPVKKPLKAISVSKYQGSGGQQESIFG
jgi:hypothetical protein